MLHLRVNVFLCNFLPHCVYFICEKNFFIGLIVDMSQECRYYYTIGTDLPIVITQSAAVCLIYPDTFHSMWTIDGEGVKPITETPFILYINNPVATFINGPLVECSSDGITAIATSRGMVMLGFWRILKIIFFLAYSGHSGSSDPSDCKPCGSINN